MHQYLLVQRNVKELDVEHGYRLWYPRGAYYCIIRMYDAYSRDQYQRVYTACIIRRFPYWF